MRTTIDKAGRLVIPKELRQQARLKPGVPLDIQVRNGHIEIEPAPLPIRLVHEGVFIVAMPDIDVSPMSSEIVEQTRTAIRQEREAGASRLAEIPDRHELHHRTGVRLAPGS